MSSPQPDVAFQLADALLGHIVQRLTDLNAAPERAFVCGESTVPADDCCDGLVWVRVATIIATPGDGSQDRTLRPAVAPIPAHATLLEAGAMRCAPTLDEQGNPPAPEEYTASALASAQDRQAIRAAIECDLPADLVALNADGQLVGAWLPIDDGGCAGGYMTTQIVTSIIF